MSFPITIYGFPPSTYTQTALLCAAHKGADARLQMVDIRSEEFLKANPFGKVPVLNDGEVFVSETLAIAQYLDNKFEGPNLLPTTASDMVESSKLISVALDHVDKAVLNGCVRERFVKPMQGRTPDETYIKSNKPMMSVCCSYLDAILAGKKFLVSSEISFADYLLLPIFYYFQKTPEGAEILPKTPNLTRWMESAREIEYVRNICGQSG